MIQIFLNAFVTENKTRTSMLEKNSRLISRSESKESGKILSLHKTTPIRETKASRLRAASIISPNGRSYLLKTKPKVRRINSNNVIFLLFS